MKITQNPRGDCFSCGLADLESHTIELSGEVRGNSYTVTMMGLKCPNCGYQTIEGAEMPEFGRLLADEYRKKHGLLTSTEILTIRDRLEMSQEAFARYVGVGVASVKRWELGKIQDDDSNARILLAVKPKLDSTWELTYALPGSGTNTFYSLCDFGVENCEFSSHPTPREQATIVGLEIGSTTSDVYKKCRRDAYTPFTERLTKIAHSRNSVGVVYASSSRY